MQNSTTIAPTSGIREFVNSLNQLTPNEFDKLSTDDKAELQKAVEGALHRVMLAGLNAVEALLPNHKVDGHADQKLHYTLRRQILSQGNDQKRKLPELFKGFRVIKEYNRQVVVRVGMNIPASETIVREGELQD